MPLSNFSCFRTCASVLLYHPCCPAHVQVDETSGSVCLDVINQTWSPMFDLINVFEVFLPQLLLYPNPADPLNGEAASLLNKDPAKYNSKVVFPSFVRCCWLIVEFFVVLSLFATSPSPIVS